MPCQNMVFLGLFAELRELHGPAVLAIVMTVRLFQSIWMWQGLVALAAIRGVWAADAAPVEEVDSRPPGSLPVQEESVPDYFRHTVVLADGMHGPDGLARDPGTGDLFVSEEDAVRILRIRPDGSREVIADADTPIYERVGISRKRVGPLRSPEGMALDRSGSLYVVEDVPGGRLIRFADPAVTHSPFRYGLVEPVPVQNSSIAWESVDTGPNGELLMAGSTVEAFPAEFEKEGLFRGVVVYRDSRFRWWMLLDDAMASYSAVAFSDDATVAFFACEISGDVGCLDLQSHILRTYHADRVFKSPEGICALPDGSALVAEERGRIWRMDPITDRIQAVADLDTGIETVLWDESTHRLLVTDDGQGRLLALEVLPGLDNILKTASSVRGILFQTRATPVEMIPDRCPDYLTRILEVGGYDPGKQNAEMIFKKFARKYCLVAIDADVMLLSSAQPVEDPFKRIQFMIVAPYLMGSTSGQLLWSSSGFAAIRESGKVLRTELVQRDRVDVDLLECTLTPMGGKTVALPMPFSARINGDGIASVSFMGMGVMPDFYLILNTVEPNNSFMVTLQAGRVQQYALQLPPFADSNQWVVALTRTEPDVWKSLSSESKLNPGR